MHNRTELFRQRLTSERYANEEATKKYGYVDFIIQIPPLEVDETISNRFPEQFNGDYFSSIPGVMLSNGDSLHYCRAKLETVLRLTGHPDFDAIFVAESWRALFSLDYLYWRDVFEVETQRLNSDGGHSHWRGKLRDLTLSDKVLNVYPPGVFAGDKVPKLELADMHLEQLYRNHEVTVPQTLIEALTNINDQLIYYLANHPDEIYRMSPREFEELIAKLLERFGWKVTLTKQTRDGGYDIFGVSTDISGVRSNWLVECKKFAPSNKVGIDVVRSLCGVKNDLKVANAMIATTSFFSRDVWEQKSSRYDLELVDYDKIVQWLRKSYKKDERTGIFVPQ